MSAFDQELKARLDAIRAQGLLRELRRVDSAQGPRIEIGGRTLLNFSSNDYLGLANHPALKEAATKAVEKYGAGAGASRLISGSLAPFNALEQTLAAFKGTEAALTFSTGYAAAVGTITALLGVDDIIIVDKLAHACIIDAAKLSGAKLRVFAHNDLDDLEDKLKWAAFKTKSTHQAKRTTLIVTESIFSMDGDAAPLKEMVALKEKYGAWLMVDEAHATGLYGANRRGLAEELGVSNCIEIQMGTLGKALGASGGYICGSRTLVDFLVNRARSFIFSTAPVPAAAAAAAEAIRILQSDLGKQQLRKLGKRIGDIWGVTSKLRTHIPNSKVQSALAAHPCLSAIVPIIVGSESDAVEYFGKLQQRSSIFVPAIRYPTVARGAARLRVTVTAAHSKQDIVKLLFALEEIIYPVS